MANGFYDENGIWRGGDPEQDQNQYDPVNNPGGSGTGLPVPTGPPPGYNSGGTGPGPAVGEPPPPTPPQPGSTLGPTPGDTPPINIQPWGTLTPPDPRQLPPLPQFTTPPPFAFKAPSVDEALNDPGYIFRRDQGDQGLQAWAAAKGTLNDTGTAKALEDYNGSSASQEYANIWNRDWQTQSGTYGTNLKSQYEDPFQFALQGYNSLAPNILHQNDLDYQHAYDLFLNQDQRHEFDVNHALGA